MYYIHDLGVITDSDSLHLVDRNKIREKKLRVKLYEKSEESSPQDLYLEGSFRSVDSLIRDVDKNLVYLVEINNILLDPPMAIKSGVCEGEFG